MNCDFKERHPFAERLSESTAIRKNHPNLVPVVVVKGENCLLPGERTMKFNVDENLSVSHLAFMIRARIKMEQGDALFLLVGNVMPSFCSTMGQLYQNEAESDGFLYVVFNLESAFG